MYITQNEAAKLCGVHITTIRRLRKRGVLSTFKRDGINRVLISRDQVLSLLKEVISK